MLERPPSPNDLIGDNWPSIDEVALATLSTAFAGAGTASQTAEQKAYTDGNAYNSLLPEGFEKQVEVAFKVGGMAADLSAALGKAGGETAVVAQAVMMAKVQITVTVGVAEALIAAKEAEIAALQAASLRPEIRAMRIQQLRNEIEQITNEAKSDIRAMYNGIYTPTAPATPGLTPITHNGPAPGKGAPPAGNGMGVQPLSWGDKDTTGNVESDAKSEQFSEVQRSEQPETWSERGESGSRDSAPSSTEEGVRILWPLAIDRRPVTRLSRLLSPRLLLSRCRLRWVRRLRVVAGLRAA